MMRPERNRILLIGGAVGVLAIAAYTAGVLWRASRATTESARELQAASEIRFTAARLDRPPAGGFEWFSTPAVFADAVPFHDRLYICGPAGLFEYDLQGALKRRFRPGLELPPAPLGALAVGTGSGQPELYITTAGEGLVILGEGGFRQTRAHSDQKTQPLGERDHRRSDHPGILAGAARREQHPVIAEFVRRPGDL